MTDSRKCDVCGKTDAPDTPRYFTNCSILFCDECGHQSGEVLCGLPLVLKSLEATRHIKGDDPHAKIERLLTEVYVLVGWLEASRGWPMVDMLVALEPFANYPTKDNDDD